MRSSAVSKKSVNTFVIAVPLVNMDAELKCVFHVEFVLDVTLLSRYLLINNLCVRADVIPRKYKN